MTALTSAGNGLMMLFVMGWGLIIGMSLVISFMKFIFSCVEDRYNGVPRRNRRVERGECYKSMSPERQKEIDDLRKNALQRYLSKFTLTLGDENLLCCIGQETSQSETTLSISSGDDEHDDDVSKNESCHDIEENGEIEENRDGETETIKISEHRNDTTQNINNNLVEAAVDSAVEYTHISLPLPGYDNTGKATLSNIVVEKEDDKNVQKQKKWKMLSLFRSRSENVNTNETQIEPASTAVSPPTSDTTQTKNNEKRKVPIFCAICLTEYEKNERVCWSSHTECSHVFHEDCIMQWLMTSGKKQSMNQFFDKNPSDEELLKNEYCPCCRQDFICVSSGISSANAENV